MYMSINSIKNHIFNFTSMPNISIQKLSLKELEMSLSTEDQEPYSRVSEYQTGLNLRIEEALILICILDRLGIMLCMT